MHFYNSSEQDIILKEYGRTVQSMISQLKDIPDIGKRTQNAKAIIELMKQLHPSMKDANVDYSQKLWDDLFCMANFDLEIETTFPKPDKATFNAPPKRVDYAQKEMKFKHYGRNVERLIEEAKKITDAEERENAVIYIGKLMKALYGAWNKEIIEEEVILEHLRRMSNNELVIDIEKVKNENLLQTGMKLRKQSGNSMIKDNGGREPSVGRDSRSSNNSNNNNNRNRNRNRNNGGGNRNRSK